MVLNSEVWDRNIARQSFGEILLQQEAFAEASATPLRQLRLQVSSEHCPSDHQETEITWEHTDPQEQDNRWQVKGAQRWWSELGLCIQDA